MNFISLVFLGFLLLSVVLYYIFPVKLRWTALCLLSAVFYFYAGWDYFLVLCAFVAVGYGFGLWLGKLQEGEKARLAAAADKAEKKTIRKECEKVQNRVCALCVVLLVAALFVFKYLSLFLTTVCSLFGKSAEGLLPSILLPLGLSFYLFQSMGYVIDVKRGECGAEKNFFKYFLFIAYFPQLLQGPIERYNDLAPQLYEGHGFDADNFAKGGQRIAIGFFKKVVIADMAGIFVDQVLADETQTGVVIALMLLFYAIQLYADFSGFMDIACGVSKLFGIRLAENFDTPYLSLSVAEFWRRWHITLGAWFRDYLYYPFLTSKLSAALMKKRKAWATALATTLGLLLVWVCMGLWHGAAWSFLFYGLYHGGLIILGNLTKPLTQKWIAAWKIDENSALFTLFRMARTFLLVCFGYVFFVTGDIGESFSLIARMFSAFNWNVFADGTLGDLGLTAYSLWQIALGILILVVYSGTMKPRKTYCLYTEREKTFNGALTMVTLMIAVVFAWVLLYALGDYTSDFVYFQF